MLITATNIFPKIESVYRWGEEVIHNEESVMILKTKELLYEKVEERIREIHSYICPSIVCFKIKKNSKMYLQWM